MKTAQAWLFHILKFLKSVLGFFLKPLSVSILVAIATLLLIRSVVDEYPSQTTTLNDGDTLFTLETRDIVILPEGQHDIWVVSLCYFSLQSSDGVTLESVKRETIPVPSYTDYQEIQTTIPGGQITVISGCDWENPIYWAIENDITINPEFGNTGTRMPVLENALDIARAFQVLVSIFVGVIAGLLTDIVGTLWRRKITKTQPDEKK